MNPNSPLADALVWSLKLHRNQTRKESTIPYVTHLWAVAGLVGESGGSETEMVAALLHDAVEDQGGAPVLAEIRQRFGDEVARIVAACTDTDQTPKPPWRERKEAYLAHLAEADSSVRRVSFSDKTHNLRCILADLALYPPEEVWSKFNGGREGTLWYYRSLGALLSDRDSPYLRTLFLGLLDQLNTLCPGS